MFKGSCLRGNCACAPALPSLIFACQAALGIYVLPTSWPPCGPCNLLERERSLGLVRNQGMGPQKGLYCSDSSDSSADAIISTYADGRTSQSSAWADRSLCRVRVKASGLSARCFQACRRGFTELEAGVRVASCPQGCPAEVLLPIWGCPGSFRLGLEARKHLPMRW